MPDRLRAQQFDAGNDGYDLQGFLRRAKELNYGSLSLVEVAVLRMFTYEMHKPWNAALRNTGGSPTDEQPLLGKWATCIAVLCGALKKLAQADANHSQGSQQIAASLAHGGSAASGSSDGQYRVFRGLDEENCSLPKSFFLPSADNYGFPGGAEPGFLTTTKSRMAALSLSGGWGGKGCILDIDYNLANQGADLSWVSVYPRQTEQVVMPPLTMLNALWTNDTLDAGSSGSKAGGSDSVGSSPCVTEVGHKRIIK